MRPTSPFKADHTQARQPWGETSAGLGPHVYLPTVTLTHPPNVESPELQLTQAYWGGVLGCGSDCSFALGVGGT